MAPSSGQNTVQEENIERITLHHEADIGKYLIIRVIQNCLIIYRLHNIGDIDIKMSRFHRFWQNKIEVIDVRFVPEAGDDHPGDHGDLRHHLRPPLLPQHHQRLDRPPGILLLLRRAAAAAQGGEDGPQARTVRAPGDREPGFVLRVQPRPRNTCSPVLPRTIQLLCYNVPITPRLQCSVTRTRLLPGTGEHMVMGWAGLGTHS